MIPWLRAAALAGLAWLGLSALHANPVWLPVILALASGVLALANAELAVLLVLIGLCIAMIAIHPVVGILASIVLFAAEHYLGGGGARVFLLAGLALVGAFFGPVWACAAIAGYLLGAADGALAAAVSCVAVELVGILFGRGLIGATVTGGPMPPILSAASAPPTLLSGAWVSQAFKTMSAGSVNQFFSSVGRVGHLTALLAQVGLWALAAVVAGSIAKRAAGGDSGLWIRLGAVAAGVAVLALGEAGGVHRLWNPTRHRVHRRRVGLVRGRGRGVRRRKGDGVRRRARSPTSRAVRVPRP